MWDWSFQSFEATQQRDSDRERPDLVIRTITAVLRQKSAGEQLEKRDEILR